MARRVSLPSVERNTVGVCNESQLRGIDLKAERVRAGLTQGGLGARLGVSGRRIANVESQYRPATSIVLRILAALAVDGGDA